jgi:uncharacterized protein with NRDE domain
LLPGYGTRTSTVLVIGADGWARFAECTFGEGGAPLGDVREAFEVRATPRA